MNDWYIERDGHVVPATAEQANLALADIEARRVGSTWVRAVHVSTVFLCLDHRYGPGSPLLYETMAFRDGEELPQFTARYSTRAEAEAGHAAVVQALEGER